MASTFEPWLTYPSLTRARLSMVAVILRDVRQQAVSQHEPLRGDDQWSLGCRIYARSCFALRQASESYDWLRILPELETLRFSFAIGNIPVRFYRGTADDPPSKYTETTFGEQLLLSINGSSLRTVLRLAVEINAANLASRVVLVEMDEANGAITHTYEVPFIAQAANVVPLQAPPVSLPPVELPTTEEAELQQNEESGNSDASSQ